MPLIPVMATNPDGAGFLRTLRVFTQLPEADLRRIADQALPRTVARGEYLFREDDPSTSCFILKAGRVQLLKRVDASRKHLATRKAGELVGEIELLYGTPRMADALAASDLELLELPQAASTRSSPTAGAGKPSSRRPPSGCCSTRTPLPTPTAARSRRNCPR